MSQQFFAYEIPLLRFTLPVADNVVHQHRFVAVHEEGYAIECTDDYYPIGVSMNEAESGQALSIANGIVIVDSAEELIPGDIVSCDADGKAIKFNVEDDTIPFGVVLTSSEAASPGSVTVKTYI